MRNNGRMPRWTFWFAFVVGLCVACSPAWALGIDRGQCAKAPGLSLDQSELEGCITELTQASDLPWELLRGFKRHLDETQESPAEKAAAAYILEKYRESPIFEAALKRFASPKNDLCSFTDNELIAALGYSFAGPVWSAALRGDSKAEVDRTQLPGITSLMSKFLGKLPDFPDQYVLRGMDKSAALKDEFQKDKEVRLEGYTSTTQDPRVMRNFGNACMLIQTKSGKDFRRFSAMYYESEILIDAGHTFLVKTNKPFDDDSLKEIRAKKCATYHDTKGDDWFTAQACAADSSFNGCERFLELEEIGN
ncbi:MAG: ADP-ribosyltransferase domain-containing protein [Bdellovibrionota bacterium]